MAKNREFDNDFADEFENPKGGYHRNKKVNALSQDCPNCKKTLYRDSEGLLEICSGCGFDPETD